MGNTTKSQRPRAKVEQFRRILPKDFQNRSATLKTKYYHLASNLDLAEGLRLDSRLARSAPVAGFGDPRADRHGANIPL